MSVDDPSEAVMRRAPWRAALVGVVVCAAVVLLVTAGLAVVRDEPLPDSAVWWSTSSALVAVAVTTVAAVRTRLVGERGDETAMRVSVALLACFAGLPVLGLLAVLVGDAGPGGLDYVAGGATIGVGFGLPVLGCVGLCVAGCVSWVRQFRDVVPVPVLLATLPMTLAAVVPMAFGLALGSSVEGRGLGAVVRALLSTGDEVESAAWLALGRVSAAVAVAGLIVLVLVGRRLRSRGDPAAGQMVRERWLR